MTALHALVTDTLLTYALFVDPDPLQVNGSCILTLVVSNSTRAPITCGAIRLTLPVGTNAKDLIPSGVGIETQRPPDWSAGQDGGVITLTPSGDAGTIKGDSVTFVIATSINGEPGTATMTIDETASSPAQPTPAERTATIALPKFPIQFRLSELTTQDHDVAYGGSAMLMWTGAGEKVIYTLEYQPADDGVPVTANVCNVGPYTAQNLTRSGSVIFTLTASVTVPGQDEPLIAQRERTVAIETLSLSLAVAPPTVGMNGLARLRWRAPNADHCTLEDGTVLPASGVWYVVVPRTHVFTVTAYGRAGDSTQDQRTVMVDPAIVPTEAGHVITGSVGDQGARGKYWPRDWNATPGDPGARGGDAVFTGPIPPLDLTVKPARVIPVVITGGSGGVGGRGGETIGTHGQPVGLGQRGGNGGEGGNAVVDVTFDSSAGAPAQYIVTVTAGPGGAAGAGGDPSGAGGGPGSPGSVSITIDGQVVSPIS
jgi:hypothetical protein